MYRVVAAFSSTPNMKTAGKVSTEAFGTRGPALPGQRQV